MVGERTITRFRSRKIASLLAYLACGLDRAHPRELLVDTFWPEGDSDAGRLSLRVALASLRRQLEPPGVPQGVVIHADRVSVRLNASFVSNDVIEFLARLDSAEAASDPAARTQALQDAVDLYRGELLAGYYEEWVLSQREHLADLYAQALNALIDALAQAGELDRAALYARRAVQMDPLCEEAHLRLMQLQVAVGRPSAARRQYQALEQVLDEELGERPAPAVRAFAAHLDTSEEQPALGVADELERLKPDPVARLAGKAPPSPRLRTAGPGSGRAARKPVLRSPGSQSGADSVGSATVSLLVPAVPESATEVNDSGLDSPVTEAQSLQALPHLAQPGHAANFPLYITQFFGRERELASLGEMLGRSGDQALGVRLPERLITLTGPAGSGKTRLAVEAAERQIPLFRGAVWFVPLADLRDSARILDTMLAALRIPQSAGLEPLQQIAAAFRDEVALLVLDNFEQLVGEGAEVVWNLLERVPRAVCLVTSRQRLSLPGEREFPVPPLPVPQGKCPPDQLLRYESAQLFVDRARLARPDFGLTAGNAAAVAELCCRLEGIPLALELAAARSRSLAPAQMVGQINSRFDFLVSRQRNVPTRHQSLRAAVDWSYNLLSPASQHCFAQLSVFRGGWNLDGAQAVCLEPRALELMEPLCECSILQVETLDDGFDVHLAKDELGHPTVEEAPPLGADRYRMLECLREFAAERLEARGESEALRSRHFDYYYSLMHAVSLHTYLTGPTASGWLRHLDLELENLRCALEWGGSRDPDKTLELACMLSNYWLLRGRVSEGREWIERILPLAPGVIPGLKAVASRWVGEFAFDEGDLQAAREFLLQTLDLAGHIFSELIAATMAGLGEIDTLEGHYDEAERRFEESLRLRRRHHQRWGVAQVLRMRAEVPQALGEYDRARAYLEESVLTYREMGSPGAAAVSLAHLGLVLAAAGSIGEGRAALQESLGFFLEQGDQPSVALCLKGLADAALAEGDIELAMTHYQRSLIILKATGFLRRIPVVLEGLGLARQLTGRFAQSARLLGAAESLRASLRTPLPPSERPRVHDCLTELRAALGDSRFTREWAAGRALSWQQAVGEALDA